MTKCIICFKKNNIILNKWTCYHSESNYCKECINKIKICPLCRNDNILKDRFRPYKNMKDYTNIYKQKYQDNTCISSNHNVFIVRPYGILIICNDCETVKPYNLRI